jgi:anti-anti-sigma factor
MEHRLTLSTTSQQVLDQGDTVEAVTGQTSTEDGLTGLSATARTRSRAMLAREPVWKHRLILTGKLDYHSTPELAEEIECLCEEGVTILTLDLRQLDEIDSTGVTAIARRGAICKMRGHDFAVIPASGVIRHALSEAGATDLLIPDPDVSVVRRLPSRSTDDSAADRSTAMIKNL